MSTVDNERSKSVLLHELGHSFAGLADEYYVADVAYNEMYPKGVEPLEPNVTRHLNPDQMKWKDLVTPGLALPTEWGKEKIEALQTEQQKNSQAMRAEVDEAKKRGASAAETAKIEERYKTIRKAIDQRLDAVRKEYAELENKVGLFEGAAYTSKGMYRSMMYCAMIYHPRNEFCSVCQRAIQRMIDFYAGD